MISVKDLCKSYGPTKAIDNLNFSVKEGEIVGFLGPNGAGKTTTMKILTGFMAPSSGQVEIAGYDIFEDPIEVKKRIGYLPETPPVYAEMRVESYLEFVAQLKRVEKRHIKEYIEYALTKTHLHSVKRRLIGNLSKGYRQRVGIAQALVSNPDILILDEPTVGLDPRQVAEVRKLIAELKGKHTILISTHILPEVQATCDRIIIINNGQIIAQDTLRNLLSGIEDRAEILITLRSPVEDLIEKWHQIDGVSNVKLIGDGKYKVSADEKGAKAVLGDIASKDYGLLEYRNESVNLEHVFLRLTESEYQEQSL